MPVRPTLRLSPQDAKLALLGLMAVDMEQMRRAGPNRPRVQDLIRERKIRYTRHDPAEHWQTYEEILGQIQRVGFALADCEDQATLLAAELRVDGIDPTAKPDIYRTGPRVSHVVTQTERFGRLDPSKWSGMGWDEPSDEAVKGYRELLGLPGSHIDQDRMAVAMAGSGRPLAPRPTSRPAPGRSVVTPDQDLLGAISRSLGVSLGAPAHPLDYELG